MILQIKKGNRDKSIALVLFLYLKLFIPVITSLLHFLNRVDD